MPFEENLQFLKDWECRIISNLRRAKTFLDPGDTSNIFFSVGTTAKPTDKLNPYTTPIRKISNGVICGAVVFTRTQAAIAVMVAEKYTRRIVVDAERKFHVPDSVDSNLLRHFGVESEIIALGGEGDNGCGSNSLCRAYSHDVDCYLFKSNDMTVEGIWQYLALRFKCFNRKKCTIVGGGNIGFKLAIKLVESGSIVNFVRRDPDKGIELVSAINTIRHHSAIGEAFYYAEAVAACVDCDVVIGCTDGLPAITADAVKHMRDSGVLIDVGKGSISQDGLNLAHERCIDVLRFDVTCALDGMIATIVANEKAAQRTGRAEFHGSIGLVSGGFLGAEGDIVVDDFRHPCQVFGICNGLGDFKQNLSQKDVEILQLVKSTYKIDDSSCK
ncbi:hypothetical protein [Maridesulfovibrio sp. FT414]|uniref:hypothetical protein n=1 Tax=Maridesulfovibrio sp. FT414 TaxID=2979469 RepID=UPI003D801896